MTRARLVLLGATLVACTACVARSPRATGSATRSTAPARAASLDSATIANVCENADSVRARLASCRLRNQIF